MKCPKCGYLGFEPVDRCRNCGYEFSLAASGAAVLPELPFRDGGRTLQPLDDLSLIDAAMAPAPDVPMSDVDPGLDRLLGEPDAREAGGRSSGELPLFGLPALDHEALIKRASPPRPPLAVRRPTPDGQRLRAEPRMQTLDLDGEREIPALRPQPRASAAVAPAEAQPDVPTQDASIGARLAAVVIDLLILAFIDAVVVYFTMQICGLSIEELDLLPKGPLLAFLFVQNGGYLVAFTAGGQTLGKMAAGIRVVPADDAPLDLGRAFLRTLMWLVLAVPAGLGFLSAVLARDHRGLHDRFAGTRVVR